ncbi:hypothetical protein Dsin_004304 [Dipteronia sinensis]|uniref:Uncharacterized protein n=1 Tax=Dipteronia sinensis TaxID=43782 RepID=A0AAE0B9C1_9ROSI|nr:hypothetical protein Dsin_004304 [Dipteronia sinensis]
MANDIEEENERSSVSRRRDFQDKPPAPFIGAAEVKKWSFYRALIAEFFGAVVFLYVTIMTMVQYRLLADPLNRGDSSPAIGILGIAWTFGVAMFLVVYSTTNISGGHVNPAVTFGLLLARKVPLVRAVLYVVVQCLGALCGVAMAKLVMGAYEYNEYGGGANLVADGYSNGVGLAAEIIGTFVLVYVVFSSIDPKRNAVDSHVPVLAPVPVGLAVFVVHLATISITRAGINPARSLAATVVWRHTAAWRVQWIFWIGPFVGAAIAAFFHQVILRGASVKALGSFRSQSHL